MNEGQRHPTRQETEDDLARVAEIAAAILDGEEIARIVEPKAMHHIAHPDPDFRFLSSDYYDVDHGRFLRTKKLLMRLERMARAAVHSCAWVRVEGADAVTLAVQNGPDHRYYNFGSERMPTPPEMDEVFRTGRVVRVSAGQEDPLATALAPVRDSLGDVVAVAEFTSRLESPSPTWA